MTQQELLTILLHLRQIADPQESSRFWKNLFEATDELSVKLEKDSFVIRRGERGVRLCQPCGFVMIEVFDAAYRRPKSITREKTDLAWSLLNTTLSRLRPETPSPDPIAEATHAPSAPSGERLLN